MSFITDKPVNKGHLRERQHVVFIDKINGLYLEVILFYLIKDVVTKVWPLFKGGLYSEVDFKTGLTVFNYHV